MEIVLKIPTPTIQPELSLFKKSNNPALSSSKTVISSFNFFVTFFNFYTFFKNLKCCNRSCFGG